MKFLWAGGGIDDERFGYLTAPNHRGVISGIRNGHPWAADMGCIDGPEFVKRIDVDKSIEWLELMEPYRQTCLFISGFDVVGNAQQTLEAFNEYHQFFDGWPIAYVAQDGQEDIDFPPVELWQTLFVGGKNAWKLSEQAEICIYRAVGLGKRVHIGRVNWLRRYNHFASMEGSNEWTCDGTRHRFGKDLAIQDWARYMQLPRQPRLFVPGGDSGGQSGHG